MRSERPKAYLCTLTSTFVITFTLGQFFFRLQKAGGDVKKKGKPDPYAYLPLNTQSLNKR